MTDSDERVLARVAGMREAIDAFEAGRLSVDRLAWELKSRIAALDEIADRGWVDELRSMRNQLEVVSSFFIESGRLTMSYDERREADDILGELRTALLAY